MAQIDPPPTPSDFFANSPDCPDYRPAASARGLFSANGQALTHRPLSKIIQSAFAAFCPVSKLHPFFAPCIFSAQISRFAKSHPFLHFSFVCKNQCFFTHRNFKGVFGFFYFRAHFSKTGVFLRAPKIRLYFNQTKRGGIFHFKPPKQHLKLKFIFLKSTQNLWKGF